MNNKTVILITGATASGKTALAIRAAKNYHTSIISADSRQCYSEMNIGVAKPSEEELASVHHYFINSHSIHDKVNAATFAAYANNTAEEIFRNNDVLIMAGGTGLYIRAFTDGLHDIPIIPASVREDLIIQYAEKGMDWLQEEVKRIDPKFFGEGEIKNPQRLMRALEVMIGTGKSIKDYHKGSFAGAASEKYTIKKYAIDVSREQLYENINQRVERMIEDGLVEEVMALAPYRHVNALQTVGYTELFDHLDGKMSLMEAVEKIAQNTRNYAKRQLTWFRKDPEIKWINDIKEIF